MRGHNLTFCTEKLTHESPPWIVCFDWIHIPRGLPRADCSSAARGQYPVRAKGSFITALASVIPADNLRHLVRLRHIAIVGQFCAVAVAAIWLQARLPLSALLTVICLLLLANIATWTWLRSRNQVSPPIVFAHLLVDTAALTALLFLTGGADNPFSGLYLLTVVIAAIALPRAYAWSVAAVTAAC